MPDPPPPLPHPKAPLDTKEKVDQATRDRYGRRVLDVKTPPWARDLLRWATLTSYPTYPLHLARASPYLGRAYAHAFHDASAARRNPTNQETLNPVHRAIVRFRRQDDNTAIMDLLNAVRACTYPILTPDIQRRVFHAIADVRLRYNL